MSHGLPGANIASADGRRLAALAAGLTGRWALLTPPPTGSQRALTAAIRDPARAMVGVQIRLLAALARADPPLVFAIPSMSCIGFRRTRELYRR